MPHLVVFLARHASVGAVAALVFVGGLLAVDAAGLRTLALRDPSGAIAIAMLTLMSILTFASVAMGAAVMLLTETGPGGGGRRLRSGGGLLIASRDVKR